MLAALWPLLTIVGFAMVNSFYPGVEAGNGIIDDLRVRPLLVVTMLAGMASGVASLPTGLVAIFRKGERSLLIFPSVLLGLLLYVLLIGEIFFEH